MHIYIIPFRVNFDCDDQKLRFRSSGGRALVWGAAPKQARTSALSLSLSLSRSSHGSAL